MNKSMSYTAQIEQPRVGGLRLLHVLAFHAELKVEPDERGLSEVAKSLCFTLLRLRHGSSIAFSSRARLDVDRLERLVAALSDAPEMAEAIEQLDRVVKQLEYIAKLTRMHFPAEIAGHLATVTDLRGRLAAELKFTTASPSSTPKALPERHSQSQKRR